MCACECVSPCLYMVCPCARLCVRVWVFVCITCTFVCTCVSMETSCAHHLDVYGCKVKNWNEVCMRAQTACDHTSMILWYVWNQCIEHVDSLFMLELHGRIAI